MCAINPAINPKLVYKPTFEGYYRLVSWLGWGDRVRVRVTLRLAVYRQSVRLGAKPLETYDQYLFFN
jgi:hypothetical protein